MPRTFSLARLLLAITVLALLCGWAVNYPQLAREVGFFLSALVPALLVFLAINHRSYQRVPTSITCLFGGFVGWALFPSLLVAVFHPTTLLRIVRPEWLPALVWTIIAIGPVVGVLLSGITCLCLERYRFRAAIPQDERLDQ